MTDATQQIGGFDPGRVLQDQVAAWTKERDRLQELIDTVSPAATPSPVPADTAELPPLPQATVSTRHGTPCYTADQMRDYARTAVASRPAPVAEPIHQYRITPTHPWMECGDLHWPAAQGYESRTLYSAPVAAAPVAAVPEGWKLVPKKMTNRMQGLWSQMSAEEAQHIWDRMLYAAPSQPDQSAQEGGKDSGCRMTGGICACRPGGSFGGCAKERAHCCTNEPAAAPSAAQAAGVELDEQLHQFRSALEIIGVGDAPDPRRAAAETLVQAGFWKREALATTPSEGVAAPEWSIDPDGETALDWQHAGATLSISFGGVGRASWVLEAGGKVQSGTREFGVAAPVEASAAAFKNFHRSLCARFDYPHDEQFWWRDQVSLEEHIAKLVQSAQPSAEQVRHALAQCAVWIAHIKPEELELWRDTKVADINRVLRAKGEQA